MLDHGNAQLSAVGFYNPTMGQEPVGEFFGGASAGGGPLPYEVQWDAELDGGGGGWKVFLPTPHLLSYDGGDVAISGVTAIADGWHSLDDVPRSSTHVWLVLSVVDATGAATAALSPAQGQSATGTTVYNVCVAEVSYAAPAAAGDPPTVAVKQSLVGALHLGGGGKTPPPGNFEPVFAEDQSDHKVKLDDVGTGFYPFGRLFYQAVTVDSSAKIETGYIYLEVNHPVSSQSSPTVYVKGDAIMPDFANSNDTSKSLIPLYYIGGGRIEIDFRSCMSLTVREL